MTDTNWTDHGTGAGWPPPPKPGPRHTHALVTHVSLADAPDGKTCYIELVQIYNGSDVPPAQTLPPPPAHFRAALLDWLGAT